MWWINYINKFLQNYFSAEDPYKSTVEDEPDEPLNTTKTTNTNTTNTTNTTKKIVSEIVDLLKNIQRKVVYKLNTHEDTFYIHKTVGMIVLSNYLYRFYLLNTQYDMNLHNLHSMILLVFHSLLSFSSLFFKLSNVRNRKIPIIYPEFRIHNIVFALRSVLCCFSFYLMETTNHMMPILCNMGVCLLTMKVADETTKYFHTVGKHDPRSNNSIFQPSTTPLNTTMRNMPYDTKLSLQKIENLKKVYSYMQIYATYYMLGNINSAFIPMFAIQISSFLMTLVKKGIIPPMLWHPLYFASLLINILAFFTLTPVFIIKLNIASFGFSYWRMKYGYNKYIGWLIVFAFHLGCSILFENPVYNYDNYWFCFLFQKGYKMGLSMKALMGAVLVYHLYKYPTI